MKQVRADSMVPMIRNLGLFFAAIITVITAMVAGQFPDQENPYVPALSSKYYYEKSRTVMQTLSEKMSSPVLQTILKAEIPALSIADVNRPAPVNGFNALRTCLNLLAGVRLEDPLTFLKAEVPMMDVTPVTADNFDETEADVIDVQPTPGSISSDAVSTPVIENTIKSDVPLVALYNTHTSETFELTDGLAHLKGKAGGIATVTREIQSAIQEQYAIPVAYSAAIHDMTFNKSYAESEKTVKELLRDNSGLEMIFDIHRDGSITREQSLVKINGQNVARILLVVGTDARAEHPKWRENLELAKKIAARMDVMYPGLSRGITIKQGRYNQQFNSRILLVEIGSAKNSTDEATAAGRLFANVIVAELNDMRAGK